MRFTRPNLVIITVAQRDGNGSVICAGGTAMRHEINSNNEKNLF